MKAIEQAWSEGVLPFWSTSAARTNSEMAIEMLSEERRSRVVVCNAPVVEGAVMAGDRSGFGRHALRRCVAPLKN